MREPRRSEESVRKEKELLSTLEGQVSKKKFHDETRKAQEEKGVSSAFMLATFEKFMSISHPEIKILL